MAKSNLLQDAFSSMFDVPRAKLLFALLACLATALHDVVFWIHNLQFRTIDWLASLITIALWLAAIYGAAISNLKAPAHVVGFVRFSTTLVALLSPIIVAFSLILLVPRDWHREAVVPVFVLLLLTGVAAMALLPAWPVAQALSPEFVRPTRLLKSTKGHRWQLLFAWYVGGAGNKLIPDLKTANNGGEAALIVLGGFGFNLLALLLTASVAATAWHYALRQDPSLLDRSRDTDARQ